MDQNPQVDTKLHLEMLSRLHVNQSLLLPFPKRAIQYCMTYCP